ncbi:hypothetical protein BAY60_06510 [Prauserella muralis]|uniref:Uncharacterized protein n=2 Tax=Prauserella muralis TaxID=588067 RepID=A0A2V4BA88_9PSEU|nr:hypothetical protein BAY60_06510 [Prauserella muralis]TWE13600.1 hypothetical protein FHX69_5724 [Prauserella muralis]
MTTTGPHRRLAFCSAHDRQHRWIRHAPSNTWWYLPSHRDSAESWWVLRRQARGLAGGRPGWYCHEQSGQRIVDTYSTRLYRARAVAESVLGNLLTAR